MGSGLSPDKRTVGRQFPPRMTRKTLRAFFYAQLLTVAACSNQGLEPVRRESTVMGTFVSVTIFDEHVRREFAQAMIDSVFEEMKRIESIATDYADSSDIGQVNAHAGIETVSVSKEIARLVEESILYSETSLGAFDITVGPLVHSWDFLSDSPRVLSRAELNGLLPLVNYRNIVWENDKVFLKKKGMRLDLGAIAKGYAVDRAIALLKRRGLTNVIVDLGGNLGVSWDGTRLLDSTRATIFIRHPRRDGEMFGHFEVGTSGVSTSGDYQRYFTSGGVRYHHILDPHTGEPARDVVSVTIVAGDATKADALSTTVFVLGREKGMSLIEDLKDVEGMIIHEQGDTLGYMLSSGLKGRFVWGEPRD